MVRPVLSPAERDLKRLLESRTSMSLLDFAGSDTAKLTSALSLLASSGGGTLTIPPGTYSVSTGLTWDCADGPLAISAYGAILNVSGSGALWTISDTGSTGNGASFRGGSWVDGGSAASAWRIEADYVLLQSATLEGFGAASQAAVYVQESSNVAVVDLSILNATEYGVRLNGSSGHSACSNFEMRGCRVSGSGNHGVFLNWNSPSAMIVANSFVDCGENGIWVGNGSDGSVVSSNVVTTCGRIGIEIWKAARCTVSSNVVAQSGLIGISTDENHYGSVTGNTVDSPSGYGLENAGGLHVSIVGNAVQGATTGISASSSASGVIVGNTVEDTSSYGVQLYQCSDGYVVTGNRFVDPAARAVFVNSTDAAIIANNYIEMGAGAVDYAIYFVLSAGSSAHGNMVSDPSGSLTGGDLFLNSSTVEGVWTAWSPTFTGITAGNGTVSARYRIDGRTLYWHYQLVLGSTSAVGTNPKLSTPSGWKMYNAGGTVQTYALGKAFAYDSSAGAFFEGGCYGSDTADDVLTTRIIFGSTTVSATTPFTWASGDILAVSGTCEVEPS